MTGETPIRVGIIGAGAIVRQRHLPNLKKIRGVDVKVACNRHLDSASSIAEQFRIPEVTDQWQRVIDRPDIDVIWIGTNPHMHAEIAIAALDAGKHVFCQARMARDIHEARQMLDSARTHPDHVTMLCPPPNGMKHGLYFRDLLERGEIGIPYHFALNSLAASWADPSAAAHWRQKREISGNNILSVGIYAEVLGRLIGDAEMLCAQGRVCIEARGAYEVRIPDFVQVIGQWPGRLEGVMQWSGVAQFGGSDTLEIFGNEGTLKYDFGTDEILMGRQGDKELHSIPVPAEFVRNWTVEKDFIRAIREGLHPEPSFETGVRYMRFVEAVTRSMQNQAWVSVEAI